MECPAHSDVTSQARCETQSFVAMVSIHDDKNKLTLKLWIQYVRKVQKQECIPVGCVPSATVAVCSRGVPAPGECLLTGVVSQHADPPRGQRDRCKNITFATSLPTVIRPCTGCQCNGVGKHTFNIKTFRELLFLHR